MKLELQIAIMRHQNGELGLAESAYRSILASAPCDADALHCLGALPHQKGDNATGERLVRKALKRSSGYIDAKGNDE